MSSGGRELVQLGTAVERQSTRPVKQKKKRPGELCITRFIFFNVTRPKHKLLCVGRFVFVGEVGGFTSSILGFHRSTAGPGGYGRYKREFGGVQNFSMLTNSFGVVTSLLEFGVLEREFVCFLFLGKSSRWHDREPNILGFQVRAQARE